MRYASIRDMDISNGEGIGIALFVQGCHFHCRGCFNQETWDFSGGKPWNDETQNLFIELANKPYIKRISILGGEPLCDENVECVLDLITKIRDIYKSDKKIWLYTGYDFDEIMFKGNLSTENPAWFARKECVLRSHVVVDGKFQINKQDLFNEITTWAGSTNQRIINIEEVISNTMYTQVERSDRI